MKKIFFRYLPRLIIILFTLFISFFALDAFQESKWLLSLSIHLIPSFILLAAIVLSFKHERIGGILLLLLGLIMSQFFHSWIIAVPVLLVGALFLISSFVNQTTEPL